MNTLQERIEDPKWLKALRSHQCFVTLRRASEGESVVPAHLRCARSGGMGMKPDDRHVFPLSNTEHQAQHNHPRGEVGYWLDRMNQDRSLAAVILTLAGEGYYHRHNGGQ